MTANAFHNISQIEASLWEAADQLRANSKLTSSEYCMPVLGVIFLRHATNRYQAAVKA
ncbi:MAG: type I restriction-modification system subunit M N-terminal domain-containing protein, partial [Polaromonas sp.]|nr:type I restriction-modification system subunit M N-terminal domain-containing protein [Polaromonas sp.]